MPLSTCPDCEKEISASAALCPNCGRVFVQKDSTARILFRGAIFTAGTFPFSFFLGFMIFYHGFGFESWVKPSLAFGLSLGFVVSYLMRVRER